MAFTQMGDRGVPGAAYVTGSPVFFQDFNRIRLNFDDHEERIATIEGQATLAVTPMAVSVNTAIPAGYSSIVVRKLAIASGITLTVGAGARLRIL